MVLPTVEMGQPFTKTVTDGVRVELGPDGVGKALRMTCDADEKYASFGVTITLTSKPTDSEVPSYGLSVSGGGEVAVELDVVGTYLFNQTIDGVAGNTFGSASSTVTFTLEESDFPEPHS